MSQGDLGKIIPAPTGDAPVQALSQVACSPNSNGQQQRCSSDISPTPPPQNSRPQSVSSNSNCSTGKAISPSQPCIKVPVPPTPHLSNLKRSNFTNLAQYLSGSENYRQVPSPTWSLSPPHGEIIETKNLTGNGGGSIAKRRKVHSNNYFLSLLNTQIFYELQNNYILLFQFIISENSKALQNNHC